MSRSSAPFRGLNAIVFDYLEPERVDILREIAERPNLPSTLDCLQKAAKLGWLDLLKWNRNQRLVKSSWQKLAEAACVGGQVKVLALLQQHGKVATNELLWIAVDADQAEVVESLRNWGDYPRVIINLAYRRAIRGDREATVNKLLHFDGAGAKILDIDSAAKYGSFKAMKLIVERFKEEKGEQRDRYINNALLQAIICQNVEAAKFLVHRNPTEIGFAVKFAREQKQNEIAKAIVDEHEKVSRDAWQKWESEHYVLSKTQSHEDGLISVPPRS